MTRRTWQRPGKSSRAFTLAETLVTAGLFLALSGLLFPTAKNALDSANRARCQGNLRQIAAAVLNYTTDHNGQLPIAAPHELGGPQGKVSSTDTWLPARMFGGTLPEEERPLNAYLDSVEVFRSPCDRGEPLWWFDTAPYQKSATCYELYGSSYFYASGYNRMGGVMAPMGIAKFVGPDFFYRALGSPLPPGLALRTNSYPAASKKVILGSIPIYRTMTGIVALSERAQWYKNDPDHLWANAAFLDGHVEFVRVFPYDSEYAGVSTEPDAGNPYF